MTTCRELTEPAGMLFDMGGVLLQPAETWDEAGFALSFPDGLPVDAPLDWFLEMSRTVNQAFLSIPPPRPAIDARPMIREALERRGVAPDPGTVALWHRVLAQWEVRPFFPWVLPTLARLREMGYAMGVVSNTVMPGFALREHFEREGVAAFLEVMVFSGDFGVNKPDPAIFREALGAMGVAPGQAWYVGDKPQRDVLGAHRARMTAVLVDSAHHDRIADGPDHVPDLKVRDISALPETLARLRAGD